MLLSTLLSQQRTFWSKLESLRMGEGGGKCTREPCWGRGYFPQRCRMTKLEETRNRMNTDKIFKYLFPRIPQDSKSRNILTSSRRLSLEADRKECVL